MDGKQQKKVTASGFTLVELLIVVAIVGVLAAISIIRYNAVVRGSREQMARARLYQLAEIQQSYRVGLGRRRFGTLAELRSAQTGSGPLLPGNIAPLGGDGQPVPVGGWIIREVGTTNPDSLRSSFGFAAQSADASVKTLYCVYEDGIVRRGSTVLIGRSGGCNRNSPPVDN
jgi:prepilin-type N-terminal cleavage/methylation domain-containing protein